MAAMSLVIDPATTAFALHDRANGIWVTGIDAPTPETASQWASSADTDGELRANLRYTNRTITCAVQLQKTTDATLDTLERSVGKIVAKLAEEGGILRLGLASGKTIDFTVLEASAQRVWDKADVVQHRAQYAVAFICSPFGYGAEQDLGDNVETTLPVLVFTEASIPGDVPALGRLVIDEDQGVNQWWMTWGIQSRYYSSSANAALFLEAEGRTALGGAAIATGPTGASGGASNNVLQHTSLQTGYLALMSTQAVSAGAHLSHVGSFHAYLRVQVPTTNTGLVTVALEWAEADFLRYTRNAATTIPAEHEGRWRYVDLGLVTTTEVLSGTQRWEGRIVGKSTVAGDDINLDYLLLVPATEGSGIASGVARSYTPTAYVGEDHFTSTTAGNALGTRTAPTGGSWATSGDATDYAFSDDLSGENLKRSAASGTNGRFAVLGTTAYAACSVACSIAMDAGATSGFPQAGVISRWVDSSNHLRAVIYRDSSSPSPFRTYIEIHELIAGTKTVVAQAVSTSVAGGNFSGSVWKVELAVTAAGLATATMTATGQTGTSGGPLPAGTQVLSASASIASAATGNTLDDGKPGIFDLQTGATPATNRYYDDFLVASIPADAAAFASQSIEIRSDRVLREDSGGTIWAKPSSYKGDYLLVPPSGPEARTNRIIVKFSRNDPFELDNGIDDLSARLFVIPRYLAIPD